MINLLNNHLTASLDRDPAFQEIRRQYHHNQFPLQIEGLQVGFLPFLMDWILRRFKDSALIVVPTEQEAESLVQDLGLFPNLEAKLFPAWGTLPYSQAHPLPSVFGERARVLNGLLSGERRLVVTSLRAFLTPLPEPEYLSAQVQEVAAGESLDTHKLGRTLGDFGYLRVPRVTLRGEFALRGEVVDLFPYGEPEALRIVLDYDRVAEIRQFDPLTQASTQKRERLTLTPLREVILTESLLKDVKQNLLLVNSGPKAMAGVSELVERLEADPEGPGTEWLYPLCFAGSFSLLDYLKPESTLFLLDWEGLEHGAASLRKEYLGLYKQARIQGKVGPAAEQMLLDLRGQLAPYRRIFYIHSLKGSAGEGPRVKLDCDPPRSYFGNISYFREELENLVRLGYRIFIFAVYPHQAARIRHLLKDLDVEVIPASISGGFSFSRFKMLVIQEHEIFGRKRRIPRSLAGSPSQAIDTFVELNPGDYVVHVNYGIGLFNGIERIKAAGHERDYIHLEYAGAERIYLPIEQVNLIQRYIGQEARRPRLDKIGGKTWENRKKRVKQAARELAQRLVRLYSRRQTVKGFAFPQDSDWQAEFEAGFPFQETEDQLRCIEAVKQDMESTRPMDRLICGDVGYGKTEIALRAAFKAVMGGKQVALLAPTTILVEQHLETFRERFARFPVQIEMLSRFRNPGEQRRITQGIGAGNLDIVIGTHRLLQRDVGFKNLGLLVTDEEQRFGVRHKELLKELKSSVDCLTLTATPIPRTLHMSLMKIRDMSVLNTPPQNRLPIETFIQEFDEELVAQAIRQEVDRGGQVFYLHNRVQTMDQIQAFLTRLLPEMGIAVAHGQMEEERLEEVMHRFVRRDFQVLLSTSIIENGLDIPNVNTIIIDRADMFGIAQLYQLRGRVGRSDRPAFAYLLYPRARAISELAMKRLKIISDFTELGSGFKIALKDLEIRGAGNLLGREQHGDILSVGLDMYLRLLDEAIRELGEQGEEEEAPDVYLELEYSGFIPDSYITEPMEKVEVYKKIASITTREELDALNRELSDRFGPIPDEVWSLFSIAETRILGKRLFISSLKERGGILTVEFARLSELAVDRVLTLIAESGGQVYLDAKKPNCLLMRTGNIGLKEKSEFISERLSRLL